MTKEIATLKTVFADEGLIARSSGELIDGVKAGGAKIFSDERGWLGEITSELEEYRIHPYDNHIPYEWTRKDG